MRRILGLARRGLAYVVFIVLPRAAAVALGLALLTYDVPLSSDRDAMLDHVLGWRTFGLASWMARANTAKLGLELTEPQRGMTDTERTRFVRETLRLVAAKHSLDDRIRQAFVQDPNALDATRDLRAERDALGAQVLARQTITEAILQEQIESVVRDAGFALGGQVLPPVRFRFTGLPDVMIVSRRDRIERIDQRVLTPGLPVDELARLEHEVDARFKVVTFVTDIGGLGAYPTMLPETASLKFALEVGTHEWLHNYLVWRLAPVAVNYLNDSTAQTINETTAVIFEHELSPLVLQRYYPDVKADLDLAEGRAAGRASPASVPAAAFDFNKEMRETRLRADQLLSDGRIDDAEQYMEERRKLFVQNGYQIRKLNQAYFAFYGAYNAEPGGAPASGRDPIGPAVQALRARSASLLDFVERISRVRTRQDVEGA